MSEKINTRALPSVNYEPLIEARAKEVSGRNTKEDDCPERVTSRLTEHVTSQREKFEAWGALGDHYAETLENPATPADVHNALADELIGLAHKASLSIDSPDVVRLLYPLLRERAEHRESREASDDVPMPTALQSVEATACGRRALRAEEPTREPPPTTPERAVELTDIIIRHIGYEDEVVRALVLLIQGLTYERDLLKRECACIAASHHAFSRTMAHDQAVDRFAEERK